MMYNTNEQKNWKSTNFTAELLTHHMNYIYIVYNCITLVYILSIINTPYSNTKLLYSNSLLK